MRQPRGFTLAELLIALAILGVIATFTIPKVLVAQQDAKYNAIGKEVAGMISGAYQAYQVQNSVTTGTRIGDLTPYMNYVAVDTSSTIDHAHTLTTITCSATITCLKLHNGAILEAVNTVQFGGTGTTNALFFYLDPDGRETDGTTNGPGKSLSLWLYYNGKLRTRGQLEANTYSGGTLYQPMTIDPPWFSWD